jgi:hypothetical protein
MKHGSIVTNKKSSVVCVIHRHQTNSITTQNVNQDNIYSIIIKSISFLAGRPVLPDNRGLQLNSGFSAVDCGVGVRRIGSAGRCFVERREDR